MSRTDKSRMVYQLRIDLEGSKPPIWRRVLVPAAADLGTLHWLIQRVMSWDNSHLHQFKVGARLMGSPEQLCSDTTVWDAPEIVDEADITLADLRLREGDGFEYLYDFGDSWHHGIRLEKVLERDPNIDYPVCIKAVRAAPPEDVGGIFGYYGMLQALEDPEHPDHEMFLEWLMVDKWDPAEVDLDGINDALRRMRV